MTPLIYFWFLYYTKQIDSMLPCICSVIDHRRHQNAVRTLVTHSFNGSFPRLDQQRPVMAVSFHLLGTTWKRRLPFLRFTHDTGQLWNGYLFLNSGIRKGQLFCQNENKELDLGWRLPVWNFVSHPRAILQFSKASIIYIKALIYFAPCN